MKTVLTIDDSKVVRTMVGRALQTFGVRVLEAQHGGEGLTLARADRPDLILLDVTMPVMDGRQTLAEIRGDASIHDVPVIMLTAESGKDIVIEIARLGVTGYIVKPFKQDTFEKEVAKVLGSPEAAAEGAVDPTAVLVVDDSEKVLDVARAALARNMKVLTALSGAEALETYRNSRPGVVVVDLAMPDMDGFATLAELRKLGRSGYVALSVRGDDAAQEKARKAGYHGVVGKPFREGELLDHVLTAASSVVAPEDLVKCCLGDEDGCPVFAIPPARVLSRLLPEFAKRLRSLAEDGNDRLIIDVARLEELSSDHVTSLARMLAEASGVGLRTAICTTNAGVIATLRELAEAGEARWADTRGAARACL